MEEGQTSEQAVRPEPRFVGVTDAEQVFVAVSDDLAALLGYAPSELVGVPSEQVVVGLDDGDLERARRRAVYDGGLSGELLLLHRSGRPIRYRYSMRVLRSGAGALYVTVGEPVDVDGGRPHHDGIPMAAPTLLTKSEAAAIARRSVRSIDRAIASGELPATGRPGERRLIELRDLQRWLGLMTVAALVLAVLCLACFAGVDVAVEVMRQLGCPFAMG